MQSFLKQMANCIVHIGIHKTGSTSIQNSLNGFEDENFVYLKLRHANHSVELGSFFGFRKEAPVNFNNHTLKLIEKTLLHSKQRTVVISGEDISAFNTNQLKKFADFLHLHFTHVQVIGYVRSPGAYMQSAFQEVLKSNPVKKINFYRNFENTFKKFDNVFGAANVKLIKFDRNRFENGCVVTDFCNQIGLNLPINRITTANESICLLTSQLISCYMQYYDAKPYMANLIDPISRLINNKAIRISPKIIETAIRENLTDITWMEERLGCSLSEELGEENQNDLLDTSLLLQPHPKDIKVLHTLLAGRLGRKISFESTEDIALMVHELLKMLSFKRVDVSPDRADNLRNLSLKIEAGQTLNLKHALELMTIAKEIRPNSPFISRKITEMDLIVNGSK